MIDVVLIACLLSTLSVGANLRENPLNGKHLRVLPMELMFFVRTTRNETGHITEISGLQPLMLEWLSANLNFTFNYLHHFAPLSDDSPKRRGAISYLDNGEADLLLGVNVPSSERFKHVNYPAAWMEGPLSILIPIPQSSFDGSGIVRPFTKIVSHLNIQFRGIQQKLMKLFNWKLNGTQVWISLLVAIPFTFFFLYLLSTFAPRLLKHKARSQTNKTQSFTVSEGVLYVISSLLGQGTSCVNNTTVVRLVAAAWALVCFVTVQSYKTTLISFLTSPEWKPVIESIHDIPNVPGLKITVDKGYAADFTMTQSSNIEIYGYMYDMLNSNPELRCTKQEDCLNKVRDGHHVYIHGKHLIYYTISRELSVAGKCNFIKARDDFFSTPLFVSLPKNSPYTESMSRGILRLRESGLLEYWTKLFAKEPTQCLGNNYRTKTNNLQSLSLNNLYMAFLILGTGYVISFALFILENLLRRRARSHQLLKNNSIQAEMTSRPSTSN